MTKRSVWTDLDGPVHYLDFGGPARGPVIVCVHGLGGSGLNWSAIAPLLTRRCRLIAPDLAGHGLTQSLGRRVDVAANRELLHRFIESVAGGPVILMGNSMGGMISLLEASAAPDAVAGLILLDPALPFVPARLDPRVAAGFLLYATPGVGRLMMGRRRPVPRGTGGRHPRGALRGPIPGAARGRRRARRAGAPACRVRRRGPGLHRGDALGARHRRLSRGRPTGARSARSAARCCCCTESGTGWCRSRPPGARRRPIPPGR